MGLRRCEIPSAVKFLVQLLSQSPPLLSTTLMSNLWLLLLDATVCCLKDRKKERLRSVMIYSEKKEEKSRSIHTYPRCCDDM